MSGVDATVVEHRAQLSRFADWVSDRERTESGELF
jgi:hypothetical protein